MTTPGHPPNTTRSAAAAIPPALAARPVDPRRHLPVPYVSEHDRQGQSTSTSPRSTRPAPPSADTTACARCAAPRSGTASGSSADRHPPTTASTPTRPATPTASAPPSSCARTSRSGAPGAPERAAWPPTPSPRPDSTTRNPPNGYLESPAATGCCGAAASSPSGQHRSPPWNDGPTMTTVTSLRQRSDSALHHQLLTSRHPH